MDWIAIKDILAVVGPLAGVALGSWLTAGNAQKLKLAELRREAYGDILSSLATIEQRLDWIDETIQMHGAMRYFEGEASGRDNADIGELMRKVRQRFRDDYLVLSDEFIAAFQKLEWELSTHPNMSPPEEHDVFEAAVRAGRPKLLAIARREVSRA